MNAARVRQIRIEDFDYPLPEDRIALHPLEQRDACKLLVAGAAGRISHHVFSDLPLLLRRDTLVVANETKVIRARMDFRKDTGARIEVFMLEPLSPGDYAVNFAQTSECSWVCLVGNRKRWKEGELVKRISSGSAETLLSVRLGREVPGSGFEVTFRWDNPAFSFADIVEAAGNIPIPPYLKRESEESDSTDYQTVYSHTEGSVAAPTAGLHFTPGLIDELKKYGDEFATVTLHVGAGTFQPVKSEEIGGHPMHTEWISVSRATLRRLISALKCGRDILAVGTTSVRTLESLPYLGVLAAQGADTLAVTQWMPYEETYRNIDTVGALESLLHYLVDNGLDAIETTTSIMIAPGFRWRIVNRLITNFHQPKSTLLLLVSSFLGGDAAHGGKWRVIYDEALRTGYRFLSYGDACLFSRAPQPVELPASKSMLLRAALIYAVSCPNRLDELERFSLCDDVRFFMKALREVINSAKSASGTVPVYIGEGAAPLRFLLAFAASLPGARVAVDCAEGLKRRPLMPLVSTLQAVGADISFNDNPADWSLSVNGRLLKGGEVGVDASVTSQFVSALMLVAPLWESPLKLRFESESAVSRPYIAMTEAMISRFYASPRDKECPEIDMEADWSAAAFFYEYCLVSGKRVRISGLTSPESSRQGDSVAASLFRELGVSSRFEGSGPDGMAFLDFNGEILDSLRNEGEFLFDFISCPDLVPAVAVALCYRQVPFRLKGVKNLRFKESDRLSALCTLLFRLGYGVSVEDDSLVFSGDFLPLEQFPLEIDPHGDHRIAMAFYPLELLGMADVLDKEVVSKSFPDFFTQFK